MAKCKACPTILHSGNKTGYCSVHEPLPPIGRGIKKPSFSYAERDDKNQWERLLLKVRTEVAVAFLTTVKILEDKDLFAETSGHLAVYLLLTELFHISAGRIARYVKIPAYQLASMLEDARKHQQDDRVFQKQYHDAGVALLTISHDILPSFVDPAALPAVQELPDGYAPAIRFTREYGRPKSAVVRAPRQVDSAS